MNIKPMLSVFLATALLVLSCVACSDEDDESCGATHYGIITMLMIQVFGILNGGQTNPIVTITCWSLGVMKKQKAMGYLFAQIMGGFAGYGLLKLQLPDQKIQGCTPKLCMSQPADKVQIEVAGSFEFIATTVYLLFWIKIWENKERNKLMLPQRIGFVTSIFRFILCPITNSTGNLATAIASAAFNKETEHIYIFIASQLLATSTIYIYMKFLKSECNFGNFEYEQRDDEEEEEE